MRKKSKLFFINGTILTFTALFIKFVSLGFNIYISKKIGSEALGVFSLVMAVYLFFITIATSSLSMAVTLIVSEKFAVGDKESAIKTVKSSILFSLLFGIISTCLILIFSKFIVSIFLHNRVSIRPLLFIAIGLPFISMSSCITAYFNSIRKGYIDAICKFVEFAIKFISTIILLKFNIHKGVEYICISLILGDIISEVCSFILIYIIYLCDIKIKKLNTIHSFGQGKRIIKIAFPVAITSYIRSGLSTLKQLIIPTQLEKSGLSCSASLSTYGIIHGMVLPVTMFPTVLIVHYGALLIPEISTYLAQKNYKAINFINNKIFKITSVFSIGVSSIFLFFADELSFILYNNLESSIFFKLISPLIFFIYMDIIIDCILKGLNKQFVVMCCNILDLSITTCIIYFVLPILGIKGYIISLFISEILNFSISLWELVKCSKMELNLINLIFTPIISSIFSYFIINFIHFNFSNITLNLILNICQFSIIYFLAYYIINKGYKNT